MDAREYWYYAIGLALVVAVVALAWALKASWKHCSKSPAARARISLWSCCCLVERW